MTWSKVAHRVDLLHMQICKTFGTYIHIYIYTYIHIYIYTYIHIHIYDIYVHFPYRQNEYFSSEQVHPTRLTAISTSDKVDPMQISQRFWKSRCQAMGICQCFYQGSKMSIFHTCKMGISHLRRLPQVHPMRSTAIGACDEVDPMQIFQRLWKSRCQPI